jgi:immunoglobulin-binding protein 1
MEATASVSEESLSAMFDLGFHLHSEIMNSCEDWRSKEYQNKVKRCILLLEDATRLVSLADVFSKNENIKEVQTSSIKYFLLPALLAGANGKIYDEGADREETIAVQEAYLRDFIQRCNGYEICDVKIPNIDEDDEENGSPHGAGGPPDLAKMNREREEKITRYREQKEVEERLKVLKSVVLEIPDKAEDEIVREFYLKTVSIFVNLSLDDLSAFAMEKPLLKHMKMLKASGASAEEKKTEKSRPLKPIIITRDAMQKEVFGMGYKNLPVLSIEEFYEQRVRDGWFPNPKDQKAMQAAPEIDQRAAEEEEARVKEEKEENDDEEERARKRNWDEYTDEHRRGEGNMHNKG